MEKVSQIGIEKYTENIGSEGAVMNIRVETTANGKAINAPVKKGEKNVATLTRNEDGSIFLDIKKDSQLSAAELQDLFTKSFAVLSEVLEIVAE